jgi:hypothetical protein
MIKFGVHMRDKYQLQILIWIKKKKMNHTECRKPTRKLTFPCEASWYCQKKILDTQGNFGFQ